MLFLPLRQLIGFSVCALEMELHAMVFTPAFTLIGPFLIGFVANSSDENDTDENENDEDGNMEV